MMLRSVRNSGRPRVMRTWYAAGRSENVFHEQVAMFQQVSDLLLDPLGQPRRFAGGGENGRPRTSLGFVAASSLRTLAPACSTAFVSSLMMLELAKLMETSLNTLTMGSGIEISSRRS